MCVHMQQAAVGIMKQLTSIAPGRFPAAEQLLGSRVAAAQPAAAAAPPSVGPTVLASAAVPPKIKSNPRPASSRPARAHHPDGPRLRRGGQRGKPARVLSTVRKHGRSLKGQHQQRLKKKTKRAIVIAAGMAAEMQRHTV